VTLHYEEKVGLPTTCFGETRHFVTRVTATADIPIGPGVVVPTPAVPAAPVATASSPPAAPAAPASAASK
jgi:hypothetical protein